MTTTNNAADTQSNQTTQTLWFGIEIKTANLHREVTGRVTQQNPITNRLVIRSLREAAIITGNWTLGRQQELTRMCAGQSDVDGVQEYWGDTDTGGHWHVVLK